MSDTIEKLREEETYVEVAITITDERYIDQLVSSLVAQGSTVYINIQDGKKQVVFLTETKGLYYWR